jgi:xanthine dehydrogenase YagS FAD-binding subunit
VVSISRIDKLRPIRDQGNKGITLGALATITEVAEHPVINQRYQALAQAASEVASPQLRNQGTIGGNLCQKPRCWYYRGEFNCLRKGGDLCFAVRGENQFHCIFGGDTCFIVHPSDTAPALIALDASVTIAGPQGSRQVPVESFHMPPAQDPRKETILKPHEIVTEINLPAPPDGMQSSYRKVRARRSWDFALAGVALAMQFDGPRVKACRVVFSGVAPVPWRSQAVEEVITNTSLEDSAIAEAADAAVAEATPLGQNAYKISLVKGMIEEELRAMKNAG